MWYDIAGQKCSWEYMSLLHSLFNTLASLDVEVPIGLFELRFLVGQRVLMQLHARVMSSGLLQLYLHYSYLHWWWFVYGTALNLSESDRLAENHMKGGKIDTVPMWKEAVELFSKLATYSYMSWVFFFVFYFLLWQKFFLPFSESLKNTPKDGLITLFSFCLSLLDWFVKAASLHIKHSQRARLFLCPAVMYTFCWVSREMTFQWPLHLAFNYLFEDSMEFPCWV